MTPDPRGRKRYPRRVSEDAKDDSSDEADLELMRKAEAVLGELDRNQGLIDRHADVLAALRIRLEGGPRKSLEELMDAAGEIRGRKAAELDDRLRHETSRDTGDLADLMAQKTKKTKSLDDLLG